MQMQSLVPDWVSVPGEPAPVLVKAGIVVLLVGLADVGLSITWMNRDGSRRMAVPAHTALLFLLGVGLIAFGVSMRLT